MSTKADTNRTVIILLLASLLFFVMGFMFPLLQTGYGIGPFTFKKDTIYLHTSFSYFFGQGEFFIGSLLLFFTILFPIIKYIFLFLTAFGVLLPRQKYLHTALEIINKWAMLDVFVVAVLILNLKFDSGIIVSKLGSGTMLFAISVVLMMIASFLADRLPMNQSK